MTRLTAILAPLALTLALLVGWELACRGLQLPVYLLPAPSAIAAALAEHAGSLFQAAWEDYKGRHDSTLPEGRRGKTLGL